MRSSAPLLFRSSGSSLNFHLRKRDEYVEDYGSGQLSRGVAIVVLEPSFAAVVSNGAQFHVFLTPSGDCKGLHVTNKNANSLEVHELGGGTSSIPFDYKIAAMRNGTEAQRLVDVTTRMKTEADAVKFRQLAQPLRRTRPMPTASPAGTRSPTIGASR
ncbi:MAG TPA: hypothetical protein VHX60_00885 [Acidobacteriaceae bacterium]|nr:hypothetical protein [Acidobacteriaceae bacterium]